MTQSNTQEHFVDTAFFIHNRRKHMTRRSRDEEREERITMEIIVDAYGAEEQAIGWYSYLEDTLHFPFTARCIAQRAISPLQPGDEVEVVGMAPVEECDHEMFVMVRSEERRVGKECRSRRWTEK